MILVSFSSAEDAFLMISKNITFLARKVLKIRRSAFLGTPGIHVAFNTEVWCNTAHNSGNQ